MIGGSEDWPTRAGRRILERRLDLYPRAAALLHDLQESLRREPGRLHEQYDALHRLLRSHAAFLTRPVIRELEACGTILGPSRDAADVADLDATGLEAHLQALHVALDRCVRSARVPPVERVLDIPDGVVELLERGEVVEEERRARASARETAGALQERAVERIRQGRPGRAVDLLRQAIEEDPTRALLWNDLGIALIRTARLEEAIEAYERALELNEAFPDRRTAEWASTYYNHAVGRIRAARVAGAHDDAGGAVEHLEEALAAYEGYLEAAPEGPRAEAARRGIETCREELEALRAEPEPGPRARDEAEEVETADDGTAPAARELVEGPAVDEGPEEGTTTGPAREPLVEEPAGPEETSVPGGTQEEPVDTQPDAPADPDDEDPDDEDVADRGEDERHLELA